jgi:hypothetical protein
MGSCISEDDLKNIMSKKDLSKYINTKFILCTGIVCVIFIIKITLK